MRVGNYRVTFEIRQFANGFGGIPLRQQNTAILTDRPPSRTHPPQGIH